MLLNRLKRIFILAATLLLIPGLCAAQKPIKVPFVKKEWLRDYKPFRIAGNLYYVGTYDLACYLIVTPQGHILINTGLAESAPVIRSHIAALGFRLSDIKILLATHAHYDHVGAMAEIKKLTGARMFANAKEAAVLRDGGNSDYAMGGKGWMFQPVKADVLLRDNDTMNFGGMQIIAVGTPGHTKGATSFSFVIHDEKRSYRVLIANMPSIIVDKRLQDVTAYPHMAADYAYTFDVLKKQQFDLWLSSHASQFSMQARHAPGDGYNPEAFMDRPAYDTEIDTLQRAYMKNIGR